VILSEVQQFLAETAPFSYLDDDSRNRLAGQISVYYCAAQETLSLSPERMLLVRSGLFVPANLQSSTTGQLQPGDCYGYTALTDPQALADDLLCEEDGLIYWLPTYVVRQCCDQNPHVAGYFQGLARRRLHQYQQPEAPARLTLKIRDLLKPGTVAIEPESTIVEAARLMTEKRVSSLIVQEGERLVGILTDRDLRSRVLARELPASTQVRDVMSPSPRCIDIRAYLFEAIQLMSQHNIHHLPVKDRERVRGMITLSDLMRAQQNHPVYIIGDIHRQTEQSGLRQCADQLPRLLESLAQQQVPAHEVGRIITSVTDALTQSLIRLGEQRWGSAPCAFAWIAFGSQARMDQSINADQDNALVLAEEPGTAAESYFARLAEWVCQGLAACGIPLCPGNIMATNSELRLSLEGWQQKLSHFVQSPDPAAILGSSIFFDLRCIYGNNTLAERLQQHLLQKTRNNDLFLFHLARAALERTPPLSMLRNFVLEKTAQGEIGVDLKKRGLSLITDLVRVYALAHGVDEVNTRLRLQKLTEAGFIDHQDGQNLRDAFDVIAQVRWEKHQRDLAARQHMSNLVDPGGLHVLQRHQLKDGFQVIGEAQAHLKNRFCRTL